MPLDYTSFDQDANSKQQVGNQKDEWKASVGYGNIDLDRFGIEGDTKVLLTRLQWIY